MCAFFVSAFVVCLLCAVLFVLYVLLVLYGVACVCRLRLDDVCVFVLRAWLCKCFVVV